MVVVVEGLHPSVARLDGEAAGDALGGEQLVPVCKEKPSLQRDLFSALFHWLHVSPHWLSVSPKT